MADERPVFVATPEGVDMVIRAARLRRFRQAGIASAVSCVVAVAAVLAVQLPGGPQHGLDRLRVVGAGTPTPSAPIGPDLPTPQPSGTGHGSAPSPGDTGGPGPAPTSAAPTATRSEPIPVPSTDAPVPTATPTPADTGRHSPITRSSGSIPPTDVCSGQPDAATSGWCFRYLGPDKAHRGESVTVSAEVCRLGSYGSAVINFRSTREVDLTVNGPSGAQEWQAGDGERYTKPGPTVTVQPGQCLVWSSVWDTRDEHGFLVPPGSHNVTMSLDSDYSYGYAYGSIDVQD